MFTPQSARSSSRDSREPLTAHGHHGPRLVPLHVAADEDEDALAPRALVRRPSGTGLALSGLERLHKAVWGGGGASTRATTEFEMVEPLQDQEPAGPSFRETAGLLAERRLRHQRQSLCMAIVYYLVTGVVEYVSVERHPALIVRTALSILVSALCLLWSRRWRAWPQWYTAAAASNAAVYLLFMLLVASGAIRVPVWVEEYTATPPTALALVLWALGVASSTPWPALVALDAALVVIFVPLKFFSSTTAFRADATFEASLVMAIASVLSLLTAFVRQRDALIGARHAEAGTPPAGGGDAELASLARGGVFQTAFTVEGDEDAFRRWWVGTARTRTLPISAILLVAFVVQTVVAYVRLHREIGAHSSAQLLGTMLGVGAAPPALLLSMAYVPALWRAIFSRGWAVMYACAGAVLCATAASLAALPPLHGGTPDVPYPERAVFWGVVHTACAAPLSLVTMRVRFSWTAVSLLLSLVVYASVAAFVPRALFLLGRILPFWMLTLVASWHSEGELRDAWVGAGRPTASSEPPPPRSAVFPVARRASA
eukprot:tig00021012_g16996.t1